MARDVISLTEAQKAEVETLAAVLSSDQVADYFGIGRTTFYALMRRDPEIAARYKKGKARAIGAIAQGLIAKARSGDTVSMIFYLKTQGGWRETFNLEKEPETEVPTLDLSGMSDAALMELAGAIRGQEARDGPIEGTVLIGFPGGAPEGDDGGPHRGNRNGEVGE